ncbi:hypothetical protein ID866_11743 [Astraeus odoratus]|nr:hypothetical protein ID866_11743 [Astraeus odoratus]
MKQPESDIPLTISGAFAKKLACNKHRAVNHANKICKHLAVTGIRVIACMRHGCFVPNTVVDFQKGEQQMNIDYALC